MVGLGARARIKSAETTLVFHILAKKNESASRFFFQKNLKSPVSADLNRFQGSFMAVFLVLGTSCECTIQTNRELIILTNLMF